MVGRLVGLVAGFWVGLRNLTGDPVGGLTGDPVGGLTGDPVGGLTGDPVGRYTQRTPSYAICPSGHFVHTLLRASGAIVLPTHGEHCVLPGVVEIVPASQLLHPPCPGLAP